MSAESPPTATLTITLITPNGKITESIQNLDPAAARTLFDTTRTALAAAPTMKKL